MAKLRLDLQLTGFKQAQGKLKQFGSKMKSVGASMQKFSLPLALAGGAAIKMGADFDKSMTKIKSLVGLAAKDVDKMGKQAREMAKETGISSQQAGDALFYITSAGLEGAEAMSVLNASLKASASGLGDVSQVADLATSAMNAYGSDTLSATDATDVLTAAVREGKLNSEDLASSMGQVLPVASNMGVSFNEVGAAMAAMSRTGTNAAQGATQLNSILSGLLKPTKQAEEALAEMGLSSGGLKKQIKDEGLLSVLETLKTEFDKNGDAAARVFPNIRALRGVLDLTGAGAATTREIFDELNASQGATKKAFDETAKSASFRLKKALNGARESFSEMGAVLLTALLPAIQKITGVISNLFKSFTNLDSSTQNIILGVGALVIALPTLLSLFGTLVTVLGTLMSPIGAIAAGLAGIAYIIATNWAEVAPVLVGLYNRFVDLYNSTTLLRVVIGALKSTFKSVFIIAQAQVDRLTNAFSTFWKLVKEFSEKGMDGSFKEILKEGFENGEKISAKAGEDIADTFAKDYQEALDNQLSHATVESLNTALTDAGSFIKGKLQGVLGSMGIGGESQGQKQKDNKPMKLGGIGIDMSMVKDPVTMLTESMTANKPAFDTALNAMGATLTASVLEQQEKMEKFKEIGLQMGDAIKGTFSSMGSSIAQSLGAGESALGTFAGTLIQTAMTSLGASLATTMGFGAEAAGNTAKSMGPLAAFVLPALLAAAAVAVKGSFSKIEKPKKFAKGGIVSTPTMGLFGEYPGAKSNPEVVAPLDKLKNMIGERNQSQVNVSGQFALKGQDLVVALQRANKNRDRIL
jgi:TP901 family phage tail tape measure protein